MEAWRSGAGDHQDCSPAATLARMQQHAVGLIDSNAESRSEHVRVVAVGIDTIRRDIPHLAARARELLSVGVDSNGDSLYSNHRATVALRETGLRMVSLFDYDTAADKARTLLATLTGTPYYFCRGSVQMKILDRRTVLLEGPALAGQRSLIAVTHPQVAAGALRYWRSVQPTVVNAADTVRRAEGLGLTIRQREIAGLMTADLTDETIAHLLGVSVRTVRGEIAAILRDLGVRTRFSAGLRLGQVGFSATPAVRGATG